MNNGFSSIYFSVNRGVRQGDPIAPYLFIMVLEILTIHIRENKNIRGIKVANEQIKISTFADDLTMFLQGVASYKCLIDTLDRFELCSGLKLNREKTEALTLGPYTQVCHTDHTDLQLFNKPIKILGIYFTYSKKEREELNFTKLTTSVKKLLTYWKWRQLTVIGRIQIIKSFIIPKLLYRASMIHYKKTTITVCDKVRRLAMISEIEDGN